MRCRCLVRWGRGPHCRRDAAYRRGRGPFRRQRVHAAGLFARARNHRRDGTPGQGFGDGAQSARPDERAIRGQKWRGLFDRGQSARQPHCAVCGQGHRPTGGQDCRAGDGRRETGRFRTVQTRSGLYGGQRGGVPIWPFPGRRPGFVAGNEINRRGDGDRPQFRGRLPQIAIGRRHGLAA